MKRSGRSGFVLGVVACLATAACGADGGQASADSADYPSGDIRLITHSPSGSGGDIWVRAMSEHLSDVLGVDVRVENRPGGLTAAAMTAIKRAEPDGYVLTAPNDSFVTAPIFEDTSYTIEEDLTLVARLIVEGEVVFVDADSPYQTIDDLLGDLEEGNPQKWALQSGTSAQAIMVNQLIEEYDVPIEVVPFTDTDSTLTSILNGDTVASIGELSEASDLAEAGEIRILATTTPERYSGDYADIPTLIESGYDVSMTKARGLAGPAGLPDDVVAALEQAAQDLLEDPDYQEVMSANFLIPAYLNHEDYAEFLSEQEATYREAAGR
jgi:tripartite-type tricarboxylate transporter receptor subunit TctC